jgi:ATP-dependent DNA helicase RecQ
MFFHKNSFKSQEKEWAVLDELLTEIFFPDRTFEIESHIKAELDIDIECRYWEKDDFHGIFFNKGFNEKLGYINLNTLKAVPKDTVDLNLSNTVFKITLDYISIQAPNKSLKGWIQTAEKEVGIEKVIKRISNDEKFSLTVGFYNNTTERVKTLTKWLKIVIHKFFEEVTVLEMRKNSPNAREFIEQIEEKYEKYTKGKKLDFESICIQRDIKLKKELGTTKKEFAAYYNGYRDKMDTEKAIYRLSTLGIIDDYTVNFSANTFTLLGVKKPEQEYFNSLKNYLLKYYSEKFTNNKLVQLEKIDEPNFLRKSLRFLIDFVYKEIEQKRKRAIHDMKEACQYGIDQGEKANVRLKEYINLYFNSKYARSGYHYESQAGEVVQASLTDISDSGKEYSIEWVWQFIKIVEEDPQEVK